MDIKVKLIPPFLVRFKHRKFCLFWIWSPKDLIQFSPPRDIGLDSEKLSMLRTTFACPAIHAGFSLTEFPGTLEVFAFCVVYVSARMCHDYDLHSFLHYPSDDKNLVCLVVVLVLSIRIFLLKVPNRHRQRTTLARQGQSYRARNIRMRDTHTLSGFHGLYCLGRGRGLSTPVMNSTLTKYHRSYLTGV